MILDPLLWGIRDLRCRWRPSYLVSSRGTLKNRNPGAYPRFWKMMCFGGYRPVTVFFNLSNSTPIFSAQAVFTSLPIFFCSYRPTLSMTSPRARCHLLQTLSPADTSPCPSSTPHSDFYSRLITLSFFSLPWSDVDGNEGGMRAEKRQSSCPRF